MALLDADAVTESPAVAIGRLAWAGPLTVITSIAAVHLVRQIVIRLPHIRAGSAVFGILPVTVDTAVLCTIAVFTFGLLSAFHDDAIRRFRWIAFGALLVSFLPLVHFPELGNVPTAVAVAEPAPSATLLAVPAVAPRPMATLEAPAAVAPLPDAMASAPVAPRLSSLPPPMELTL